MSDILHSDRMVVSFRCAACPVNGYVTVPAAVRLVALVAEVTEGHDATAGDRCRNAPGSLRFRVSAEGGR